MPILSGTARSAWPRSNRLRTAGRRTAREAIRGTTGESAHRAELPPGSTTLARIPGIKTSIPGQLLQQSVHAARTDHPDTFGGGQAGHPHRISPLPAPLPVPEWPRRGDESHVATRTPESPSTPAPVRRRQAAHPPAPAASESTNPTHGAGPVRDCLQNRRDGDGLPAVRCCEG